MHTSMSTIIASALALTALTIISACKDDPTSPLTSAHGVTISFVFPGSCNNVCEPTPGTVTKLASIHVTNTGRSVAYLLQCGDNLRITQQHFDGTNWVNDGPAIACPVQTALLTLAPGASLDSWRFLPLGQYRVYTSAATTAAESDFEIAMSNTITVK